MVLIILQLIHRQKKFINMYYAPGIGIENSLLGE